MKKLVVPFVFCMIPDKRNYAWIFCKYVDFCIKNDLPMIVEEEYCLDENMIYLYSNDKYNPQNWHNTVSAPGAGVLESQLKSVLITKEERKRYHLEENNDVLNKDKLKNVTLYNDTEFGKLIDKKLDEIERLYGEIGIIITWHRYPALVECAKRRGIVVIAQELSVIRGNGYYKETFGSFDFYEKHTSKFVTKEYSLLEDALDKELILNRKEVLAFTLETEHLDVLNRMEEPIYEFGVDADPERDYFYHKYNTVPQKEILEDIRNLVDKSNVLARFHPSTMKPDMSLYGFPVDDSANSMEWILKCKRIVSCISNVGFEAMLLGRTAYILCENIPYYLGNIHTLDKMEERSADIKILNYLLFGYYVPWDLMFDCDYINWRMTEPAPLDIYRYHLSYLLEKIGLDYDDAVEMKAIDRYKYILKTKHDLSDEEMAIYIQPVKQLTYTELKEVNREYELKIRKLLLEIHTLKTSNSWKITKPLRTAGEKIRKIKESRMYGNRKNVD